MVNISLRVLCHPSIEVLPNTYKELGLSIHCFRTSLADWNERVMPSIVNEVLKQVIAQFNASAFASAFASFFVSSDIRLRLTPPSLHYS